MFAGHLYPVFSHSFQRATGWGGHGSLTSRGRDQTSAVGGCSTSAACAVGSEESAPRGGLLQGLETRAREGPAACLAHGEPSVTVTHRPWITVHKYFLPACKVRGTTPGAETHHPASQTRSQPAPTKPGADCELIS